MIDDGFGVFEGLFASTDKRTFEAHVGRRTIPPPSA